ncbi:MAG: alkaline phosphatase D family protein [Planctomycetota bacterium]
MPALSIIVLAAVLASQSSFQTDARPQQPESVAPEPLSGEAVTRIAFGSCFNPNRQPHTIWDAVEAYDPEVFVMLGDNVYADTEDMAKMRADYDALDAIPAFARVKEAAHFLATWDDHDFGQNDAGAEYPKRAESQQVMLDWAGEPEDTWRRRTPGIYDAEVFGPEGQRVQVILLDTRYFRGPLATGERDRDWADGIAGGYVMDFDSSSTMLGAAQWAWLEHVLEQPADLRIIASSIQIIPEDHRFEKWANLPRERARLFEVIEGAAAEGVVFISGDRHRAEISRFDPGRATPGAGTFDGYTLYEITSSALNRSSSGRTFEDRFSNELNRHVVGNQYQANNFGSITIDWANERLTLAIHRENGQPAMMQAVEFDELARGR